MIEIRHVGFYVENIELVKDFYVEMLGMDVIVHETEYSDYIATILGVEQAEVEVYKLAAQDGSMIELLKLYKNSKVAGVKKKVWEKGNHHIAITVSNVETEYTRLKSKGILFVSKPCMSPNGYANVCFCKDPEGNYIELVEVL